MNKFTKKNKNYENGQALVTMLIFITMGLSIATAATFIIGANQGAATNIQEGIIARQMADSGIEQAYLEILRNGAGYIPSTNPEIINLNGGTVSVNFSWVGSTATVDSVATNGNFVKKVESIVNYINNELTQISWKEKN